MLYCCHKQETAFWQSNKLLFSWESGTSTGFISLTHTAPPLACHVNMEGVLKQVVSNGVSTGCLKMLQIAPSLQTRIKIWCKTPVFRQEQVLFKVWVFIMYSHFYQNNEMENPCSTSAYIYGLQLPFHCIGRHGLAKHRKRWELASGLCGISALCLVVEIHF